MKLEKEVFNKIEDYMSVDFYENQEIENNTPYSHILDISNSRPGEIEIEDDIKKFLLWRKVYRNYK